MSQPWYRDGLRFECTRCGNCCSGAPGTVLVDDSEIAELAESMSLADSEFREIYTRTLRRGDVSLREKRNGECVFYRGGSSEVPLAGKDSQRGCSVYRHRPRQCRTWPFWSGVVHSPDRWKEEAVACPGMNSGTHHSAREILQLLGRDGTRSDT